MSNTYLEKIANHIAKGYISPAWMENSIAAEHGKPMEGGFGRLVGSHYGGMARANGRSLLHGLAGAGVGAGLGGIAALVSGRARTRAAGAVVGGALLGAGVGGFHGIHTSLKNQAEEMHKKYRD